MKKIKIIFLLLLAVVFSGCQNDFTAHHQKTADYKKQKIVVQEYLKKFRPENIQEFKSIELYHTPQSKSFNLLGKIVNRINGAQERVYLSSYIFTEKRIFEALQNAQKRGIDVKVLMEKNVYKAPFLNNNRFRDLESAGVEVAWSNPDLYSLNHTKLLIIDDKAIVSTGNYSYSSFAYNREFFLQIGDTDFVDILTQIFRSDYIGEANTHYDDRLVLSPLLTRSKFSTLVSSAQDSIKIYSQTFSDDTLEVELSKAVQAGIDVQIIFPELKEIESNRESYKIFTDAGVQVHTLKKPKLHAKAMLVDDTYLYIGSINFSYYSIEQNREIGLLITNPEIIEKFLQVWKQDKQ